MRKKVLLGGLLPFISNPAVLASVAIGAVGLILIEILSDKEEGSDNGSAPTIDGSTPLFEPSNAANTADKAPTFEPFETVERTVVGTVNSSVEESYDDWDFYGTESERQKADLADEETAKEEIIRQAMSELGKRSAAARAKKKAEE